jgi:hypothetical protein
MSDLFNNVFSSPPLSLLLIFSLYSCFLYFLLQTCCPTKFCTNVPFPSCCGHQNTKVKLSTYTYTPLKNLVGLEIWLYSFVTSTLELSVQPHAPAAVFPGKEPVIHTDWKAGWVRCGLLEGSKTTCICSDSNTVWFSPYASRNTDFAILALL